MTEAEAEKDDGACYGDQKGAAPEVIRQVSGNGNKHGEQDNRYQLQNKKLPVIDAKQTQLDLTDGIRQIQVVIR